VQLLLRRHPENLRRLFMVSLVTYESASNANLGVPLMLVVFRNLGQFALVHTTKVVLKTKTLRLVQIYARVVVWFRQSHGLRTLDDEAITLPVRLSLAILLGYLLLCSFVVYSYDSLWGPVGNGISFFLAFYFSFISLSTIGLGDIMPNNAPVRILLV